jgi:hypothetical protein
MSTKVNWLARIFPDLPEMLHALLRRRLIAPLLERRERTNRRSIRPDSGVRTALFKHLAHAAPLRAGRRVRASPSTIPVPGGGRVTVIINAKDSEGVQEALST